MTEAIDEALKKYFERLQGESVMLDELSKK